MPECQNAVSHTVRRSEGTILVRDGCLIVAVNLLYGFRALTAVCCFSKFALRAAKRASRANVLVSFLLLMGLLGGRRHSRVQFFVAVRTVV